jgi:hypothetical protein
VLEALPIFRVVQGRGSQMMKISKSLSRVSDRQRGALDSTIVFFGVAVIRASVAERPMALPPEDQREVPMPIRPFLNGEQFDQEMLRILSVAFTQVCVALRIGDCDDDVKQAIANKIIELAKTGERNPDLVCERALKDIRQLASAGPATTQLDFD